MVTRRMRLGPASCIVMVICAELSGKAELFTSLWLRCPFAVAVKSTFIQWTGEGTERELCDIIHNSTALLTCGVITFMRSLLVLLFCSLFHWLDCLLLIERFVSIAKTTDRRIHEQHIQNRLINRTTRQFQVPFPHSPCRRELDCIIRNNLSR